MALLSSVLANNQQPHQPYLIVLDSLASPGVPVFAELVQRSLEDGLPIVFVSVLHPPWTYGLQSEPSNTTVKSLDLTSSIPGFAGPSSGEGMHVPDTIDGVTQWICQAVVALGRRTQVFVDALDVLAEDYGSFANGRLLVKKVLKALNDLKAPSRLNLLLPTSSPLLPHITTPSISSSLTTLTLHPPQLINHLSKAYLLAPPPSSSSSTDWTPAQIRWNGILRGATERNLAWSMALAGESGVEVSDWTVGSSSSTATSSDRAGSAVTGGCVVEVVVRKSQGGANKGMSRSLEGIGRAGRQDNAGSLEVVPWEELEALRGLARSMEEDVEDDKEEQNEITSHPSQEHIPFNLSLTPAQAASRADVPVPYAHEGDEGQPSSYKTGGGGKILFEPGSEDDMDEDDPDEDLDF